MNKKAVIYARVSTSEQKKGYSLDTQIEACKSYAKEKDYLLIDTFQDDYTGASIDRPGLNQLRDLLLRQEISIIIVYDIDRLARKSIYQMLIEEEAKRAGAKFEYVMGQYADTDEGQLQKQIRASIAEYEKAKILERSKRGKRGKAKSGFVLVGARPPYGYKVISEPHKSWFEIDEDEAKIVRLVFQWYLQGDEKNAPLSMNAISVKLTKLGIPTRGDKQKHVAKKQGYGVWSSAMIRHILTNETYTGTWHYGKTKMVEDHTQKRTGQKRGLGKQVPRPRDEWIAVSVPQVIDQEVFYAVQEKRRLNYEQSPRNRKYNYLVSKRIKCAKCGYSYIGKTRRETNYYYYCKGREQKPISLCDMPIFRGDLVDKVIWNWVVNMIQNPKILREGMEGMQETSIKDHQVLIDRLGIIETQRNGLQDQLERLIDLYLNDDFSKSALLERRTRLETNIADLHKEHTDISTHLKTVIITEEQIEEIEKVFKRIQMGIDNATFDAKRRIIELLDLRGKLAVKNGKKEVYIKCLIGQQQLPLVQTSPLLNTGATEIMICVSPPIVHFR